MFPVSIKGVLLLPGGEVVLLRNDRGAWELPGGRIEPGESPEACLRREFQEELLADVAVHEPLDAYLFEVLPGRRVFIVTYRCTLASAGAFRCSEEHSAFGRFSIHELPEPLPSGYAASIARAAGAAR